MNFGGVSLVRIIQFEEFRVKNNLLSVRNIYENGLIARIALLNFKNNKYTILLDKDAYMDNFDICRFSPFYLFKSTDDIYFNPRFTGEICKLDDHLNLKPEIKILGGYPTKEFIEGLKRNPMVVYTQDQYITDIRDIYATPDVIAMTIRKQFINILFISRKTKDCFLTIGFQDKKYFGNGNIYGVDGNKFISLLNTENSMKKNWTDSINKSLLNTPEKNKLSKITSESNPVLIKFKIKTF